ncbi:MAG: hypothetical protein JKY65_07920 [Planctomycetes bacterium]|nr:hypothetical protein [Planctomycetota bacterium]
MDQDLNKLEREAIANPGDAEAANKLDRALLRAGREEQATKRYWFKFRCPLRFDDLDLRDDPLLRDCERCAKSVHLVRSPAELANRVAAGDCVAFARDSLVAAYVELARDERIHSAEESTRPCVQDADVRFVELEGLTVSPEALRWLPSDFAHTYQVVPISWDEERSVLEIACAQLRSARVTLEDLRFMTEVDVQLVLADPEAVAQAVELLYPFGLVGDIEFSSDDA